MAQINVSNLTFCYEGSFDNIFEEVSFSIDTNWKLGFIGRNGKGKTTFLNLLMGKYEYTGSISTSTVFDYFPYQVNEEELEESAAELMYKWKNEIEEWRVMCELAPLSIDAEILYRPFRTLSFGERTKVMLAVLFSGENDFLLIDEPTNHLDKESREIIKKYLAGKKRFILVSHDRDLLDTCIDHVLVLNRGTIEVQAGNFSSWWVNKEKADAFAKSENEKHLKEIGKLKAAADKSARWAQKNENTKIGFDPVKEPDRFIDTRAYIGAKTKKMQARVKSYETRIGREIKEKEGLLVDIEKTIDLKVMPLAHHKKQIVRVADYSLQYKDADTPVFEHLSFEINSGERVFLQGENGCGKSSIINALLHRIDNGDVRSGDFKITESGIFEAAGNLLISYVSQDTSHLNGSLKEYARQNNLEYSFLLTLLSQLGFERVQYEKNMEAFSEGQKKKVLIAASLITPAHLYIWDEPLNYIDVFSRAQIESLIKKYEPTMLIVEHDQFFLENIATKVINVKS